MKRRQVLAMLPAGLVAPLARAQEAAASAPAPGSKFVVMSLVGDELTYIGKEGGQVGTNLSHNRHEARPTKTDAWDLSVLQTLAGVVPRLVPNATMSFLKGSLPEYFSDQIDWFSDGQLTLPGGLRSAIAGEHADFLLLLTKWRGDAVISDGHEARGQGKLSGLGFYSDVGQKMSGGSAAYGFTAPYVYVKLSLADLATSRLVRETAIHATTLRRFGDSSLGALQDMLLADVREAAPAVLKAA